MSNFFEIRGKMAFIGTDGMRIEASKEDFSAAAAEAERLYGKVSPSFVKRKIEILLGEPQTFIDKINFLSADNFPDALESRVLLVRHLSWDLPDQKLNPGELQRLRKSLHAIGKLDLLDLRIEKA